MIAKNPATAFGWRIYGLGLIAIALVSLTLGNFDPGQPVPQGFPERTVLAYVGAIFMLAAGAAIEWRRIAAFASMAVVVYYAIVVLVLMNGRVALTHYAQYVTYENIAEQLAITAGALLIYASNAKIDSSRAAALARTGLLAFGICALIFGGAHFVYITFTAALVPKWLPPNQVFWGYLTGICQISAGVAILTQMRARLATILLTSMYSLFMLLVWIPAFFADPANPDNWTEAATTLVLTGVAWTAADSVSRLFNRSAPVIATSEIS